ncbi:MAG: PD-(D/E)XK nuclease family protein, partial [Solirubrobacterales bacterium]|nr:PD-(D/E)XK nuclease family protein [Solirubrobacterales bacterium]
NGGGTVLATAAARDWLRLLEALERPASTLRARTVALTPFLAWSAEDVACAQEDQWEEVHRRLHGWSRILRERGVAALTESIMLGEDLAARMLALAGGERRLTDLRHLAQLLNQAASAERLGVTALRGWLAQRIAALEREEGQDEQMRRLESDAEAVQVLTIHRSKGLEFPIVLCPFLWEPTYIPRQGDEPVFFHDPARGYERTIDVGLDSPSFRRHARLHRAEQRGEDLRLAYVALTRARHQAVIWWAGSRDSRDSALGRLLFCQDDEGNVASEGNATPSDADVVARFRLLAQRAPAGCISVESAHLDTPTSWSAPLAPPRELRAAAFDRGLDLGWRRTSYSDITAAAHDALVASEPEEPLVSDEPEAPAPVPAGPVSAAPAPQLELISPLATLPAGTAFGTFAHRVLEATDFAARELNAELRERIAAVGERRYRDLADDVAVADGLRAALETPLGPVLNGLRLCDVRRSDRLDELGFELPLLGGDEPTGRLMPAAIASLLRAHLPPNDPLAAYSARLEDPTLRESVRGFLTGSIDLVIRLPGNRFAIVDYKTNWLGPPDEPLTVGHYHPLALAAEMSRAHYGLQTLLYAVALHRYLRWRLADYDPQRHLVAVLYLFLRGMAGAKTPSVDGQPCGVFAWRPPAPLVSSLSDLLDGAQPR